MTGSHRSGTGWVGSMIAASPSHPVAYLWEPFSPLARPGIRDVAFDAWFTYVCEANEESYEPGLRDMLAYRYRYGAEVRAIRTPKDAGRMVRDAARFRRFRARRARPLLKDPIAVFSSGWIADRLDAQVIVLIRHPAAFVNSVVHRRLRHPFGDFVSQPLLMDTLPQPYGDQIRRFAADEQPLLDQGILLWNLIHHAIAEFRERRPDWLFLRLEDVAEDPLARFGEMFDLLGMPLEDEVRATIVAHSDASNPDQVSDMASTRRNSRAAVHAWRRSVSDEDLARIRDGVEPLASAFYDGSDW